MNHLLAILLSPAWATEAVEHAPKMSFWEKVKPPVDISTNGHLIDYLFNFTTALITIYFILVVLGLFGFAFFYSKKRHPKPLYTHGKTLKQIGIVALIGAAVFITVDMQITGRAMHDFNEVFAKWPDESEDVVKIEVLGQQWAWNFRYAGKDGIFNTEDDVTTLADLRLPVGKKIVFQITSKDVIHSLYFPNTRLKVDAMPSRISRMWFELTTPGEYDIACAEMCGTYHYRMKARLTVYSQEDFKAWMTEQEERANVINNKEDPSLFWGWKWVATANK